LPAHPQVTTCTFPSKLLVTNFTPHAYRYAYAATPAGARSYHRRTLRGTAAPPRTRCPLRLFGAATATAVYATPFGSTHAMRLRICRKCHHVLLVSTPLLPHGSLPFALVPMVRAQHTRHASITLYLDYLLPRCWWCCWCYRLAFGWDSRFGFTHPHRTHARFGLHHVLPHWFYGCMVGFLRVPVPTFGFLPLVLYGFAVLVTLLTRFATHTLHGLVYAPFPTVYRTVPHSGYYRLGYSPRFGSYYLGWVCRLVTYLPPRGFDSSWIVWIGSSPLFHTFLRHTTTHCAPPARGSSSVGCPTAFPIGWILGLLVTRTTLLLH